MKPLFISIDGVDGSGKSTQVKLLCDWLESRGRTSVAVRDPGGTALGEALREILLHRQEIQFGNRAEMLMYMASRAELVDQLIVPNLSRGNIVVSDRFLLSNVVYQGCAGELPPEVVWEVGRVATDGILPDLTIVLDLPVEVAMKRLGEHLDRLESRGREYMERVREGFLRQSKQLPRGQYAIIDANQDVQAVHAMIVTHVARLLEETRHHSDAQSRD